MVGIAAFVLVGTRAFLFRDVRTVSGGTLRAWSVAHGIVQLGTALFLIAMPTTPFAAAASFVVLLFGVPTWMMLISMSAQVDHSIQPFDTQVATRSQLETLISREIFRARRYQRPFALAVVDVLPPAENSQVLAVANEIQRLVRATDDVGIWSERRLIVLLEESKRENAEDFIRRMRNEMQRTMPTCTFRHGVAEHCPDDAVQTVVLRAIANLEGMRELQLKPSRRDAVEESAAPIVAESVGGEDSLSP